jgi:hypothetical protein
MRITAVLSILVATFLAACASEPRGHARVWTEGISADGYSECTKGTIITGGGHTMSDALKTATDVRVVSSAPDGNGWRVVCVDAKGQPVKGCRAYVLCASVLE